MLTQYREKIFKKLVILWCQRKSKDIIKWQNYKTLEFILKKISKTRSYIVAKDIFEILRFCFMFLDMEKQFIEK